MKRQCKPWIFISITFITFFNLLCYFAIRSTWSGIIRYTFEPMPYILLFVLTTTALGTVFFAINKYYPILFAIWAGLIDILFLGLDACIISFTTEVIHYFIREFLYGVLFLGAIGAILYLWIVLPKKAFFQKKWIPSILFILLFIGGVLWKFDLSLFNSISCTPVAYAVEDTYQITFTTRAKGTAWVVIDGVAYNETYAGYRKTESRIHKISVPMDALDSASKYTVYARSMLLRGPYCALQGRTISKTYTWKGVNPDDGLNYYVLADTHNTRKTPYMAATYFGDKLDFLISAGDNVSWIDREADLKEMLLLAGRITRGEIPVIYARGNHETKGIQAHELYHYVGADGENFYYTFRLENIWGIVLDIGENHGDNFAEYYGAAKFDSYRKEQTKFLDTVLTNAETEFDAPGVDYRIAVCHIPLTVKYENDHAGAVKDEWLTRLNQMKLTMLYSGHVHELWYIDDAFESGSTLTQCEAYSGKSEDNSTRIMGDANFPAILVSRRSDGQLLTYDKKIFDTGFWGLAVTSDGETTAMQYTNEDHEVLENIISPWFSDIEYGSKIIVENVK